MEEFQQRMMTELQDLSQKCAKLDAFIKSAKYMSLPTQKRILLMLQLNAMNQYATILACRCEEEGISVEEILSV